MIDFRYHIVSIVSIFLALAVGIVLGAGPLKGEIGSTLQNEVAGLRDDKTQLNDQLDAAQADAEARDAYLDAVSGRVLAGALRDRSVALVVLPGADASVSESVVEALGSAGARLASTTSVSPDFVSTEEGVAGARDRTVQQVATDTGADTRSGPRPRRTSSSPPSSPGPPRPVTAGPTTPPPAPGSRRSPTPASSPSTPPTSPVPTSSSSSRVRSPTATRPPGRRRRRTGSTSRWPSTAARGAPWWPRTSASEKQGTSVLTTLRDTSSAAKEVSGVDDAADPMGLASVVFALVQQGGGKAGQYGLAAGTDAAFAPVPQS